MINDYQNGGHEVNGPRKGVIYQVLVSCPSYPFGEILGGDMWVTIDPKKPLDKQTEGMLGYRLLTEEGEIIKKRFKQ
jgi:hypothetical protein